MNKWSLKTLNLKHQTNNAINNNDKTNAKIGIWFASCSVMVIGAVVLGGITRLTESGLNIYVMTRHGLGPKTDLGQPVLDSQLGSTHLGH